ncbi:LrgB family protein [Nocardioides sp. TRM66260-LWL]|uniref:LrgB family protein n=1 Tax=Nocardioides sp. TRM66260-LWL TaxID=2874478 RepID=UPI001CC48E31|nr:LrgB family protein [Nocardioides sp. TRM66260-LWL]MBZ5735252.1 LrgB family protein [Nocardioides sp. TRM66260-LWL]
MSDLLDWARTSPVPMVLLTLVGYLLGCRLRDATGGHPLAQPVVVAVLVVAPVTALLDVDYRAYLDRVSLLSFWLGPATVALAVPLHRQAHRLRGFVMPMLGIVAVGAAVSVTSGVLLVRALGGSDVLQRTMAPKATTTPVSLALSESLGGIPALSAALTILVGILGAIAGPALLTLLRVRDRRARGLAIGSVSHGIGTARVLHEDEVEGAFAGLGMGLTALLTSLLMPALAWLLFTRL